MSFIPDQPRPWNPHGGQKRIVKYLLEHAAAAIWADVGIGKTSAVLAAFKVLKRRGVASRMLVVAPLKPCYLVWGPEREKWEDFAGLRLEVLHGPGKGKALARDADIYVINPEGLAWLLNAVRTRTASGRVAVSVDLREFRKLGFDTLLVDELTFFKHHSSGRHKALKAILGTFARRWGLTATPAPNGLIDVFAQTYIIDMGRSFGPYITHYRNQYFIPSYSGFGWTLKKGADELIYERLKPVTLRLSNADYVELPELVEIEAKFDLPAEARRIYDELEDDMISRIGETKVIASNAAAVSTKCRQVASGGVYLDADALAASKTLTRAVGRGKVRAWLDVHDEKTDIIEELVNELQGSPLLVAYDFNHDLARLQKRFPKAPFIGGGTTPSSATQTAAAWNCGDVPLLFGHPASIAHGLNLQSGPCQHVAWYSMTWRRDYYDQLNGRIRRQGSTHKRIFVHHILARRTVDEDIVWALRHKGRVQNALLDAMKARRRDDQSVMKKTAFG